MIDFIHLRLQSSYSMLESALTIDKIVELAKINNMPAICVSDNGNLFGSLEFALAARSKGVQPIHGAILNIAYSNSIKSLQDIPLAEFDSFAEILILAKDEIGYQNLLKLVSYTFTKNDRKICNHITLSDLIGHQDGLIVLSGYEKGIIGKNLAAGDSKQASIWVQIFKAIFGDRFYLEIMRHNIESERLIEREYIDLAIKEEVPLVATNTVLFSDINMHEAHDTLLCISAGVTKENEARRKVSKECYFKSQKEMQELFKDIPSAIENTVNIAQRCYVMSEARSPMLPNFTDGKISESDLLRAEAEKGLRSRLETKFKCENTTLKDRDEIYKKYQERLDYELDIICRMNFPGYFLIVSDFIKWSKENDIPVGPGRGSGAGSIVAWVLLITDLDPIKFGLLFERFLNPERISMPDFDIDFCQERREEVINYVRSKYGDSRVGQIITFGKLQAKAVIKDVSRVMELPYKYADRLTELVPFNAVSPVTLSQALEEVPELKKAAAGKGLAGLDGNDDLIKQVLSMALVLEGLHRHVSVHAAGVVIAGQDLVSLVPVYKDNNSNMLVVQYSMKYAELAGLMKFDFLGLQTLTVINKCKQLLRKQGIEVNFDNVLFDDKATYEMLSKGMGTGVFQFESPGMKDTLRRLRPDAIEDLIALGALYRPGPMENIPTYIACKHGKMKPDYLHPLLKPILEETYGVIIYQEQVIEIAKVLAGYTLGSADLLRRAMGKKIKAEMDAQGEMFVTGAKALGVNESQAKAIFETVAKFAGYGFNKAHASAYGAISYQTAYLKANFPVEFLIVCLNLDIDNNDKINLFIQEAKNLKINITPPDINISEGPFSIRETKGDLLNKSILYGLGAIKGVTVSLGEIVMNERTLNGDFKSIIDFIERIPPKAINRKALENLIKAGCFDKLHHNRNQLLQSIQKLLNYSTSYHNEKSSQQFSLIAINTLNKEVLVDAPELDDTSVALAEFEVLGLFINKHPLEKYKSVLKQMNVRSYFELIDELPDGASEVKIAGVIQKKDARMSARGRFVTLQLSDECGIFDLSIFSDDVLQNYLPILDVKAVVVADCNVFKDKGGIKLTARHFSKIDEMMDETKLDLKLYTSDPINFNKIITLLKSRVNSGKVNAKITVLLPVEGSKFIAKVDLGNKFYLESEDLEILKEFVLNSPLIIDNRPPVEA